MDKFPEDEYLEKIKAETNRTFSVSRKNLSSYGLTIPREKERKKRECQCQYCKPDEPSFLDELWDFFKPSYW